MAHSRRQERKGLNTMPPNTMSNKKFERKQTTKKLYIEGNIGEIPWSNGFSQLLRT
jgi:hypothetical protein